MITTDFFILEANRQQAYLFVCRLIEKFYTNEKPVYIYSQEQTDIDYLDKLLWTFQDTSFIPHEIYTNEPLLNSVQMGSSFPASSFIKTLINLNQDIPSFYTNFEHINEIVFNDPVVQQCGREKYKKYRDKGFDIHIHKISPEYDNAR